MKNIIFIAPPSSGKGTQSNLLVKKYNYKHISIGNMLKQEASKKSKLGLEIAKIMESGTFVPDEIVNDLMQKELKKIDKPFILDGYPRNLTQGKLLEKEFTNLNISSYIAIYLNISEEEALKRVAGRINCPKCNRSYNVFTKSLKPLKEGVCDDCLTSLTTRFDDTEETFKVRYKNYLKNTIPLLNFYKRKGNLFIIDNPTEPDLTFKEIENVIK
ncbi:MAG: nucleoside monophosphate kinase [Bacilli bacterium]|nr:nucleoside monophosphate kinase [Bacilli bacterium]